VKKSDQSKNPPIVIALLITRSPPEAAVERAIEALKSRGIPIPDFLKLPN
jgi:hypothetical protein